MEKYYDDEEKSDVDLAENPYELQILNNITENGEMLYYIDKLDDDDFTLYCRYLSKPDEEPIKIDSDVSLWRVNEDFSVVYYQKNDSLFKKVIGKDKEKIVSDVYDVNIMYGENGIYYTKECDSEMTLGDFIEDDMKLEYAELSQPESTSYPYRRDFKSYSEYSEALDKYNAWKAKEVCDEIRDSFKEPLSCVHELCYYDGEKEHVLSKNYISTFHTNYAGKPVFVFKEANKSETDKVSISELDSIYDAKDSVESELRNAGKLRIAVKAGLSDLDYDYDEVEFINVSESGKYLYFMNDISDDYHGDLYMTDLSGGKAKKPELYDSDVYTTYSLRGDKPMYFKDYDESDECGELYIAKKKIGSDVYASFIKSESNDMDEVFYMTEYNEDRERGTLKMTNGKKSIKIADDVHAYSVLPNGDVAYLSDFSDRHYKGDLFIYHNGDSKKIDEDVSALLDIKSSAYIGDFY